MTTVFLTVLCAGLIISGIGYLVVVLLLFIACRYVRGGESQDMPFISVILAARNERESLERCLVSIKSQSYPADRYEVIAVDDRSTDGTGAVLDRFSAAWDALDVLRVDTVPAGISPKKHALAQAIEKARGDIILQTDADCVVRPGWIAGMAGRFEDGIDMVAGIAPYAEGRGALNSFVRHEYLWNVFLSAGSIVLGAGTHASARNLGFRRDAFMKIGGYGDGKRIKSGDDTLLLHRMQRSNARAVATLPDSQSQTVTTAPADLGAFFRQRTRHMSTGRYFAPLQVLTGVVVYGFQWLILITFFLSFTSGAYALLFLSSILIKMIVDLLIAHAAVKNFRLPVEWRRYIVNEVLMVVYMAFMPVAATLIPVRWKESV